MRNFRLWWIFPNKFLIKTEEFNKNRILLASITASAVARCASSSVTKARGAIIEFALVSKLPDANFLDYRATISDYATARSARRGARTHTHYLPTKFQN